MFETKCRILNADSKTISEKAERRQDDAYAFVIGGNENGVTKNASEM